MLFPLFLVYTSGCVILCYSPLFLVYTGFPLGLFPVIPGLIRVIHRYSPLFPVKTPLNLRINPVKPLLPAKSRLFLLFLCYSRYVKVMPLYGGLYGVLRLYSRFIPVIPGLFLCYSSIIPYETRYKPDKPLRTVLFPINLSDQCYSRVYLFPRVIPMKQASFRQLFSIIPVNSRLFLVDLCSNPR